VVQYHYPEEALQIRRLMQSAPSAKAGEPEDPGMTEEAAAFAVLGLGIEAIGTAVARHWGLDEAVLNMIRPLVPDAPVRSADTDDDMLRTVASAANETVRAAALPGKAGVAALGQVAQRYARVMNLGLRDLQAALQAVAEGQDTWGEGAAEIDDQAEAEVLQAIDSGAAQA
jgi:eukaryotic-like serine/threonine-protein kinase